MAHGFLRGQFGLDLNVRLTHVTAQAAIADTGQKADMFIQTEQTPNPATLKFLPGCTVMAQGTANFMSVDTAAHVKESI